MDKPTIAALPPSPRSPAQAAPLSSTGVAPPSVPSGTSGGGPGSPDPQTTVARLSSPWSTDDANTSCHSCRSPFHHLNRRHHCRLCGHIFCHDCSSKRSLIPPSSIVLTPKGGKKVDSETRRAMVDGVGFVGFERDGDPDRMVSYMQSPDLDADAADHADHAGGGGDGGGTSFAASAAAAAAQDPNNVGLLRNPSILNSSPDALLYGRGLEERAKLAREPLRVCDACHGALESVQEELRNSNANAMRYNTIDPTDVRRLFNSPLAFTLGHEVRKAAYTLNNLLPLPKRLGAFVTTSTDAHSLSGAYSVYGTTPDATEQCKDTCTAVGANLNKLDGVRIPARLMEQARGVAVMTVVKGGFGLGVEFGTGLVVARLGEGRGWSPPCAIGMAGVAWGALVGAQISDHVFLLMDDNAVNLFSSNDGSFQLGADVGVAVGPLGRSAEADFGATGSSGSGGLAMAPIYTYSLSKGIYAGVSLNGKVMVTRERVNEKFYGHEVSARELLNGEVPTPPAAQPLYDALKRCHVYATSGGASAGVGGCGRRGESLPQPRAQRFANGVVDFGGESQGNVMERYAQIAPVAVPQPPAAGGDHHAEQRDFAMSPDRSGGGAY